MTKDKIFNWRFCLCCGIFIWFVINLIQGIFTEIQEDETYYALYGEHLAWGYFDHPPMVGLMTFLSSKLFSGALGVRFFTIVASCLSLLVMWAIADQVRNDSKRRDSVLFFTIACSIVMFNLYGFITTPDAGLVLFSALFLLVYQRYLEEKTWPQALLMGVLMACMVYSKYHAFLFLGLIVLSNLKLLKDGKFYVACLLALALLTPHIVWQVQADFPSFKYHLMQRSEPFRWSYFLEYLPNQLLIFNPFTFGAVVYVLIRHKPWIASSCLLANGYSTTRSELMTPQNGCDVTASEAKQSSEDVFERGLCFILIGFFFFFWLMTFRGHVEPHWTIVCVVPMVVLIYRKALVDNKLKKYIKWFVLPSLLLVLALRIVLITPWASHFGVNGKETYYKAIESVAGDAPVVFRGSFQQPALYHYFTGKESAALKSYYDRMTQFDLWRFDTDWVGKPVFVCGQVNGLSEEYAVGTERFEGYLVKHFQSANRLVTDFKITNFREDKTLILHRGDTLQIDFSIYNPLEQPVDFQQNEITIGIIALYLFTNEFTYCHYDDQIRIEPQSTYHGHLFTVINEEVQLGKNRLTLGLGDRISCFVTEESYQDVLVVDR